MFISIIKLLLFTPGNTAVFRCYV